MDNRELFDNGPKLIKCEGCGRYFEEQMLKKCRVCGGYFCPECRLTHDCRETAEHSGAHHVIIRDYGDHSASTRYGESAKADAPSDTRRSTELEFIDTDGSSVGSASLRWGRSFGSERCGSDGRHLSFNDYAESDIGSADLRRYDDAIVYGDDRYSAPAPAPQAVYPPQPQYAPPMPPYAPERAVPAASDCYRPPQQGRAAAGQTGVPPVFVYVAPAAPAAAPAAPVAPAAPAAPPVIDTIPEPAEDELRCDDCGKIWKKSELRRCKKCGAVLCPKCREKHKCGKKQKANAHNAENAPVRGEPKQNRQPRKRQGGKTANKKMIMMLIVLLIFVVAIAIAAVMLVQNGSLTLPNLP